MKSGKAARIITLFLVPYLLIACSGPANSTTSNTSQTAANQNLENTNAAHTNVEELGVLVKMPFETEEAVWKEVPNQKKVVAVLRFSAADADKLEEQARKHRQPSAVAVSSETWFPPELIAQVDVSGDSTLKGTAYAANDFFQPPYTEGQVTRIEGTDYFVLEVNAK